MIKDLIWTALFEWFQSTILCLPTGSDTWDQWRALTESSEWHRTSVVNTDIERKTLKTTFVWVMEWKCKLCTVSADTWAQLFRHYRLKHSHYSTVSPPPCLHGSCICTFLSFNALKIHLSWFHRDVCWPSSSDRAQAERAVSTCSVCYLKQPFSQETLFTNLRGHLKKKRRDHNIPN